MIGGGVGFVRSGNKVDPFYEFIALDVEEQKESIQVSI